jgi:protein TonB
MKPKKKSSKSSMVTSGVVVLVFLFLGGGLFYLVSADKGGGKKVFIAKVDLVKPNLPDKSPPPPKEKPPEPEVQKKETIVAPQNIAQPMESRAMKGDGKTETQGPLGLDAEGGAGSDGFGLAGRKGQGKDIIKLGTGGGGGGFDPSALGRKFAWYTNLAQAELRKLALKSLEENGKFPKGKTEAVVQIAMDERGTITEVKVVGSTGSASLDRTVKESLENVRLSQSPPQDLPRRMTFRITCQG